jgi:hypothetical protein
MEEKRMNRFLGLNRLSWDDRNCPCSPFGNWNTSYCKGLSGATGALLGSASPCPIIRPYPQKVGNAEERWEFPIKSLRSFLRLRWGVLLLYDVLQPECTR